MAYDDLPRGTTPRAQGYARRIVRRRYKGRDLEGALQVAAIAGWRAEAQESGGTGGALLWTCISRRVGDLQRDELAAKRRPAMELRDHDRAAPGCGHLAVDVADLLERLEPLERWILEGHYLRGRTLAELSARSGLCRDRLCKIKLGAERTLRSMHGD